MKFSRASEWQASWLQGEISVSYNRLVELFGVEHSAGDGYKTQAEWGIIFDDGTYATIYDWKMGDSYVGAGNGLGKEDVINWHIGGTTPNAFRRVSETILQQTPNNC